MAFKGLSDSDRSYPSRERRRRQGGRGATLDNAVSPWVSTGVTALLLAGGFARRRRAAHRGELSSAIPSTDGGGGQTFEDGHRGRFARTPSEIPARGWKDILLRVYKNISEDRILAIAAGVAFYVILAIFPALAALVAVYGLFADPNSISNVVDSLSSVLPSGVLDVVRGQLQNLASKPRGQLGVTFLVSVLVSLWSANSGIQAIFDALNIVYHEREKRGYLKLYAESLLFTVGAMMSGLIGVALIAVLPPALHHLGSSFGIGGPVAQTIEIGRWPVMLIAVALAVAAVYRYGPSREKPRWRWVTWGSGAASVLWLGASMLFSWYASNFSSYNKTYGSLATVIIFMTWMWISFVVILLGAELDAEMEHQTVRDSTAGRPKPLGRRGAHMADTVGQAQG